MCEAMGQQKISYMLRPVTYNIHGLGCMDWGDLPVLTLKVMEEDLLDKESRFSKIKRLVIKHVLACR